MSDRSLVLISLKAAAAMAEKLASDYERGRLWECDFEKEISTISRYLDDAASAAKRR